MISIRQGAADAAYDLYLGGGWQLQVHAAQGPARRGQ